MATVTDILTKTAELGIDDIKAQMSELDMNVTGKTARSLRSRVTGNKVEILAERSILTLVFGRGPGRRPPIEPLREWVVARGLPKGLEWPIAVNIGKFGTQIFQGIRKGLDIERTKKIMIDFFKTEIAKATVKRTQTLIINLYR